MSEELERRLDFPPFGTETSERLLMAKAAETLKRYREALESISTLHAGPEATIARQALAHKP